MLTLRAGYLPGGGLRSNGLLLLLPAALYYSLFRFDVIPTLLTAISLACLGRRHWLAAGAFLGLAALVKVYPVLLAPLMLRYLCVPGASDGRGWRAGFLWLVGCGGVVAICLLPPLCLSGWEAVWAPYHYQLNRNQFLWTAYGYYLPLSLSTNTALAKGFRLGMLLVTGLGLAAWPVRDLVSLLRRGAVVLIVFISVSVVFSPQWILWLAPFVLPLCPRSRLLTILVIALDLLTFLLWPYIAVLPAEWTPAADSELQLRLLRGDIWMVAGGEWKPAGGSELLLPVLNYVRFAVFAALALALLGAEVWSRRSARRAQAVSPTYATALGGVV